MPEGYCRAYQGVSCDEEPLGRDFFGGDLAGITAKLDDLQALGVTVLYLNPIFAAPSNHRYDTSSYDQIDPDLGTQEDFETLIREADARGIRVLLDGVFNHVSSDSPWFDRFERFADSGACEAADSPYRSWFTFRPPAANEPSPCAPSTEGGSDTFYQGWFGFDTIPEVIEGSEVYDLFTGPDGIARRWVADGTGGWRLDVMDNLSHGFMRKIREAVKATDPDALVLGEQWHDTSPWLLGDEADSTMNYRFRRAVIGLINGDTADLDGSIVGLSPSQFASRMAGLMEDYPRPAFDALLNLVDSHDTTRILWTLTPGRDDPALKESEENLAEGKAKLRQLAALQLTWPGMASIYYGTEAGLTGHDDPDDRRPYPWDAIDEDLQTWYRTLGTLRRDHVALREGDLQFVHADDQAGTLAFLRRTDTEAGLTVLNLSAQPQTVEIDVTGRLPEGAGLTDGLGGPGATVTDWDADARGTGAGFGGAADGAGIRPRATGRAHRSDGRGIGRAGRAGLAVAGRGGGSGLRGAPFARSGRGLRAGRHDGRAVVRRRHGPQRHPLPLRGGGRRRGRKSGPPFRGGGGAADAGDRRRAPRGARHARPAAVGGRPRRPDRGADRRRRRDRGSGSDRRRRSPSSGSDRRRTAIPRPTTSGPRWPSIRTWTARTGSSGRCVLMRSASWNVLLRVSPDGGSTWVYADRAGIIPDPWAYRADSAVTIAATPAVDQEPPAAPAGAEVATVSPASLTLAWDPVEAADLYRYEVMRGTTAGGPYERIGTSTEPTFTDDGVDQGSSYVYVIVAVDTSFNRSAESAEVAAAAEAREVAVTFTVTVPPNTPADDTVYIAGDFQDWNPGGTPMERVDAATWSITLPFTEGEPPQYKYTRGTWEAVEKDAACGELANRTVTVTFGEGGTADVADTVEKWRDVDSCP